MRCRVVLSSGFCVIVAVLTGCGQSASGVPMPPDLQALAVNLTTSTAKVEMGKPLTFTVVISNPNDIPVNLHLGPSYSGVCFANGSALEAKPAATVGWAEKDVLKPQWHIGFCGTCSYGLVVAVPAKGTISYSAKAVVASGDKGLALRAYALNFTRVGVGSQDFFEKLRI